MRKQRSTPPAPVEPPRPAPVVVPHEVTFRFQSVDAAIFVDGVRVGRVTVSMHAKDQQVPVDIVGILSARLNGGPRE